MKETNVSAKMTKKAYGKYLGGCIVFLTGLWWMLDGAHDVGRIDGMTKATNTIASVLSDEERNDIADRLNDRSNAK